ncbi:MAG: DeoR/GlpR family DNA-binding transcription regulator, partial [Sciscionella sp.]
TTGRLARHLVARRDLTVVTNGLTVILALAERTDVELIVLGGKLRHPNESIVGQAAYQQLRRVRPDRVFLGADALSATHGVSCPTLELAELKHAMLRSAREAYIVIDHSKLARTHFPFWAPLDRPHTVVVDAGATEVALHPFTERGSKLLVPEGPVVGAGVGGS